MFTRVKTDKEIISMREGGKMLATVLNLLRKHVVANMTTKELADIAAKELKSLGGRPAFLGYHGFPDVLCVSINEEVVHGIPSAKRVLRQGDIVSMDFGVLHKGLITDAAISAIVGGTTNKEIERLVNVTEESLNAGINAIKHTARVGDISASIQVVLDKNRYGIVRDLVGHGVGDYLHEDPNIPNHGGKGTGPRLLSGMTIAVEPMATLGRHEVFVAEDGWTIITRDGSWSAHFEHTIAITDSGAEVLTTL